MSGKKDYRLVDYKVFGYRHSREISLWQNSKKTYDTSFDYESLDRQAVKSVLTVFFCSSIFLACKNNTKNKNL